MPISNDAQLPKTPLPMPTPDLKLPPETAAVKANDQIFDTMDKDNSGTLSQDEVVGNAGGIKGKVSKLKFEDYDKNGDGEISRSEFQSGRQTDRAVSHEISRDRVSDEIFKLRDKNHDHKLTGHELSKAKIKDYDTNGDGAVSRQEFRDGRREDYLESRHEAAHKPKD